MIYYVFDSKIRYIGSSMNKKTRDRWNRHKQDYKRYLKGKCKGIVSIYPYFKKYGIEKFKFEVLKKYDVCDKDNLRMYEQLWMNKLNCVNKSSSFQPLFKQRDKRNQKTYRENNKKKIALKDKKYYENNKEKIKEYQKQYRENNKDKLKQKIYCYDCDCYVVKHTIKRHYKSIKHLTNTLPVNL
jgi:hypothetical protein